MTALAIGTLALTPNDVGGISVGLSAGLSGGTGTGYSYAIYRGTDPNFAAGPSTLLATVNSMPYLDSTPGQGVQYFYGVVGSDSSATTVNAIPAGLTGASSSVLIYASAQPNTAGLNLVFVGDSITLGAFLFQAGTMTTPTAPFLCKHSSSVFWGREISTAKTPARTNRVPSTGSPAELLQQSH